MSHRSSEAANSMLVDDCYPSANLTAKQRNLYSEIMAFRFDDKMGDGPFIERLAEENDWLAEYAKRVALEYKRFIFLAAVASHPISPSAPVDKAWQLHLTDTVSYWLRLCADVIGKPIHHRRSKSTQADTDNYRVEYRQTIESYEHFFGQAPDEHCWPRLWFWRNETDKRVNVDRSDIIEETLELFVLGRDGCLSSIVVLLSLAAIFMGAWVQVMLYFDNYWIGHPISDIFTAFLFYTFVPSFIVFSLIASGKCPACNCLWVLEKTGDKLEKAANIYFNEKGCRNCGYAYWEEAPRRSGIVRWLVFRTGNHTN